MCTKEERPETVDFLVMQKYAKLMFLPNQLDEFSTKCNPLDFWVFTVKNFLRVNGLKKKHTDGNRAYDDLLKLVKGFSLSLSSPHTHMLHAQQNSTLIDLFHLG